ncbi:hypothetical protein GCM10023321_81230 [Pseudonocardia eucalypti]|uniref:Uncharacterized protein n=1 Tax=Pseudonocardia eucalypti TaxID=648755 RepID=A0ABP9RE78_9PSEU
MVVAPDLARIGLHLAGRPGVGADAHAIDGATLTGAVRSDDPAVVVQADLRDGRDVDAVQLRLGLDRRDRGRVATGEHHPVVRVLLGDPVALGGKDLEGLAALDVVDARCAVRTPGVDLGPVLVRVQAVAGGGDHVRLAVRAGHRGHALTEVAVVGRVAGPVGAEHVVAGAGEVDVVGELAVAQVHVADVADAALVTAESERRAVLGGEPAFVDHGGLCRLVVAFGQRAAGKTIGDLAGAVDPVPRVRVAGGGDDAGSAAAGDLITTGVTRGGRCGHHKRVVRPGRVVACDVGAVAAGLARLARLAQLHRQCRLTGDLGLYRRHCAGRLGLFLGLGDELLVGIVGVDVPAL